MMQMHKAKHSVASLNIKKLCQAEVETVEVSDSTRLAAKHHHGLLNLKSMQEGD